MKHETCEGCKHSALNDSVEETPGWWTVEYRRCLKFRKMANMDGMPHPIQEDCWEASHEE